MPKILSRQPRWLDRGRPAFSLFNSTDEKKADQETTPVGPTRRIAHRGTEVFVVAGNEIRWSDLAVLKDQADGPSSTTSSEKAYKVLRTPTNRPIRQISISPSGELIAVATSHTCHVCVLPGPERLNSPDGAPIPLKYFQVGPTAHVLEQSPLVSLIWHPLSPTGNDLVTITKAACVRLWELDRLNRSTFDEPALAVDLKKLGNATSVRADLSASKYGASKGFSPDEVEMEVAAGAFGGSGRDDEDGWSSMTLWVAMSEGDVYALCPFLPARFCAPVSTLASLTTSVVAKSRILEQDRKVSDIERQVAEQQSLWLAALDEQDPVTIPGAAESVEIYTRPAKPGAIPKLQGPFRLTPEPDFGEVTDIHVIAPKTNDEDLFDGEDWDDFQNDDGLSVGIVCLATTSNQVHVCLNVEGVEAEWLPSRRARFTPENEDDGHELLLLETVDLSSTTGSSNMQSWPTFTISPMHRYELFTTQPTGIYSISLTPWIDSLEGELSATQEDSAGIGLRAGVILDSTRSVAEALTADLPEPEVDISAAVAILDAAKSDIGYLVLTIANNTPQAVTLDLPNASVNPFAPDEPMAALPAPEPRAPFQPSETFFRASTLPAQVQAWRAESATNTNGDLRGRIQFTPDTLQKVTEAHRILSSETHQLGLATADLFRRCERMLSEMQSQVERVRELTGRIDGVTGDDPFPDEPAPPQPPVVRGGSHLEERFRASREKTRAIHDRVEALRRRLRAVGGHELSTRERAFAAEVGQLERTLGAADPVSSFRTESSGFSLSTVSDRSEDADGDGEEAEPARSTIAGRVRAVEDFFKQITAQAAEVQARLDVEDGAVKGGDGSEEESALMRSSTAFDAAGGARRRKLGEVMALLERETALVEAVSERLRRLQVEAS